MTAGATALLADGTVVTVRALREDDTPTVFALHRGLSERDRYLRFFTTRPAGLAGLAHTIATGDRSRRVPRRPADRCRALHAAA